MGRFTVPYILRAVHLCNSFYSWKLCYNHRKEPLPVLCTYGQLNQLCNKLATSLSGCTFRPEPIGGGGIEFTDWPGKKEDQYKSFRFCSSENYPWINEHTPNDAQFLFAGQKRNCIMIKLKAFRGAPPFTADELVAFREAFENVVQPSNGWSFYRLPSVAVVTNHRNW